MLEAVWDTLTDYENLDRYVPNLQSNVVVEDSPKGAKLRQVGAAKIAPGITFTAQTVVDVKEYVDGLPPSMEADHLSDSAVGAMDGAQSSDSAAVRAFDSVLPLRCAACRYNRLNAVTNGYHALGDSC